MDAWLVKEPGRLEGDGLALGQLATPEPGPGEIRLRVRACGVCHTDLHIAEGDLPLPTTPIVPGHQVVGVVDAVGPGVEEVKAGERRGAFWLHRACGHCPACRRGDENLCPDAVFTGFHVHGGFAEHMVVPAAYTAPIPDAFSDLEAAPLLCAGVIGYRAFRLSETRPGEHLALFGFGASAHLTIQLALSQGCQVSVFTRSEGNRRLAKNMGATWVGGVEALEGAYPLPAPADRAIIFAPAGSLVPLALQAIRPGGTVAVNAIHMSDIPGFPYRWLHGERTVRSVAHVTRVDVREFLELAAAISLRVETRSYAFHEGAQALRDLKGGRMRGAGVLNLSHSGDR